MSSNFLKNHFFLIRFGQNVHFKDRKLFKLSMFNFFRNCPKLPDFSPKKAILGKLWSKIPDRGAQFTPPKVLI